MKDKFNAVLLVVIFVISIFSSVVLIQNHSYSEENEKLKTQLNDKNSDNETLQSNYDKLSKEYDELSKNYDEKDKKYYEKMSDEFYQHLDDFLSKDEQERYSYIYDVGYESGSDDGYELGYESGYADGYSEGEISGYNDGYDFAEESLDDNY